MELIAYKIFKPIKIAFLFLKRLITSEKAYIHNQVNIDTQKIKFNRSSGNTVNFNNNINLSEKKKFCKS